MFRVRRDRRGPDPWIKARQVLLIGGGLVGLAGMATEQNRLIYLAIGLLVVAVILGSLPPRDETDPPDA